MDDPAPRPSLPPSTVTTGRASTIGAITAGLAALAWLLRGLVSAHAPEAIVHHHASLSVGMLSAFVGVPATLVVLLTVLCLNRVLLHGVAWVCAGASSNLGELVMSGNVADYIRVGNGIWSPADLFITVGFVLLAAGAAKVVLDAAVRDRAHGER